MNFDNYKRLEKIVFADEKIEINYLSDDFELVNVSNEILNNYINNKLELFMVYQPYVTICDNCCRNAEALLRIKDKESRIFINPMVFTRLIAQKGLMKDFIKKQIEVIIKDISFFIKDIANDFRVSANISSDDFTKEFCLNLLNLIKKYHINPSNFAIEILEDHSFEFLDRSLMNFMQTHGILFYLDDCSRGYSNFDAVEKFNFNMIKLAENLIQDIDKNNINQILIKNIVSYCKNNHLSCIAEHVETKEELDCCKNMGIEGVQGYYFSKPVIAQDLSKTVKSITDNLTDCCLK